MNPSEKKLNIIYNSLQFRKTKEQRYKLEIVKECKELLKHYHISEKRMKKQNLDESLIKFSGWIGGSDVINELMNSL